MTDSSSRGSRVSGESRLLLLTVAVCAVVLLLMARAGEIPSVSQA